MNQLDFLKNKFQTGKLGHAYILAGHDVESLKSFANEFVKFTGCKFPDVITVRSADSKSSVTNEKDMMEIVIEQIRDVQNFLSYKSFYGGVKTVIIENAERMTTDAQDCFLKNLEEPKGQTLVLLISTKPELMRSTISSRCQTIKFLGQAEPTAENKELLQVIQGDLAEKFKYAKMVNVDGENFSNILNSLQQHFRNLLLTKIGVTKGQESNYSVQKLQHITRLIETLNYQAVVSNLNQKLALEVLLLEL